MERSKMIGLIHAKAQKTYRCRMCGRIHAGPICLECGSSAIQDPLTGLAYEGFLFALTGKTSCRVLSDSELEMVLKNLSMIGLEQEGRKKKVYYKRDYVVLAVVLLAILVLTILTYDGPLSLLSVAATTLYEISIWQKSTMV